MRKIIYFEVCDILVPRVLKINNGQVRNSWKYVGDVVKCKIIILNEEMATNWIILARRVRSWVKVHGGSNCSIAAAEAGRVNRKQRSAAARDIKACSAAAHREESKKEQEERRPRRDAATARTIAAAVPMMPQNPLTRERAFAAARRLINFINTSEALRQ